MLTFDVESDLSLSQSLSVSGRNIQDARVRSGHRHEAQGRSIGPDSLQVEEAVLSAPLERDFTGISFRRHVYAFVLSLNQIERREWGDQELRLAVDMRERGRRGIVTI